MYRKLIVATVFAAFVATAASASYSAPVGDTKAMARYAALQKKCGVAAVDQSGKRWDFVNEASEDQYRQHLAVCAQKRHATNVPPAAYIGAGAAVGAAVVRAAARPRNDYRDGARRLTPQQREQLNELRAMEAEELMGRRPANSVGFQPSRAGASPIHCRGGQVVKKVKVEGGTYYRVDNCRR